MALTAQEVFQKAYHDIQDKKNWTQGYYARNVDGEKCAPRDAAAVCWCSAGMVQRYTKDWEEVFNIVWAVLDESAMKLFAQTMVHVNDELTHEQVVQTWQDAANQTGWA